MASTATITPSLPPGPGSLKSAFAKLDEDIFNSLAASQPGSPSLGATKLSSQPPETSSPLTSPSQINQQPQKPTHSQPPTSAPNATSASTSQPKPTVSPVLTLLTTPNMTATSISPLITPDAMLLCPHWNIPESQTRSRRHSSAAHTGATAIAQTLAEMRQHRAGLEFEVETSFASGSSGEGSENKPQDVAVFGQVQWQSEHLGRRVRVPFAVWAKVDGRGRVEFMQIVGE